MSKVVEPEVRASDTPRYCVDCGRPEDMGDARAQEGRCAPCWAQWDGTEEQEQERAGGAS